MIIEKNINNYFCLRWLDKYMIGHKGYIAGGCFKNIFNGEKVKDIDVFFENEQDYIEAEQYFSENDEFNFYYENSKVKAYKDKAITIELISNIYGTPRKIIENFDFTITKFAYYKESIEEETKNSHIEYKIICDDCYFEHLQTHRLVVDDKLLYPISSFERMIRYIKYGYYPCKETKMKIIEGIRSVHAVEGISESLYDGMD